MCLWEGRKSLERTDQGEGFPSVLYPMGSAELPYKILSQYLPLFALKSFAYLQAHVLLFS